MSSITIINELAKQWLETGHLFNVQMDRANDTLKSHVRINKDLWDLCQAEGLNMTNILDDLRK